MFNLKNELMQLSQSEGPILSGFLMRWQRETSENVGATLSNESFFLSCAINARTCINRGSSKTLIKALNQSSNGISTAKTPSHTPRGNKGITPGNYCS